MPFLDSNNEIQFQGIDNARNRLDHHVSSTMLNSTINCPRIRKSENAFEIDLNPALGYIEKLDGPIFFGSPTEPWNWGMWLLQGIQNALAFLQSGENGRFLCFYDLPFHKALLSFLGLKEDKIIQQKHWRTYHAKTIEVIQYSRDSSLCVTGYDLDVYNRLTCTLAGNTGKALPEKLFLARRSVTERKGKHYRMLINEAEFTREMEVLGFHTVEPELLSIDEQLALFRNAKVVVGLGGAGMFNTVFCRAGTKVLSIESSGSWVDNHASLFSSLGHSYAIIFGERDITDETWPHYRWSLDIPAAISAIKKWLS
jgi:capsular polysaccharide biosynthesis protein